MWDNPGMNWKRTIGLAVFLSVSAYFFMEPTAQEHRPLVKKSFLPNRLPASLHSKVAGPKNNGTELSQSGLSAEKVAAITQLRDFHASRPAFNEENIQKRQMMLEELVKDPKETVRIFSELMRKSNDDGLKSFLLNLTMNTKLEDEEKAEIFLARLKAGASFSQAGLVSDEQMSFMIGLIHLSRLENQEVRKQAIEDLKEESTLTSSAGFRAIFKDYFQEVI